MSPFNRKKVYGGEIPFTNIFAEALRKSPNPRGWEFPHLSNPIAISALISLIFAVFFAVYYAIMWFLTIPAIFAFTTVHFFSTKW